MTTELKQEIKQALKKSIFDLNEAEKVLVNKYLELVLVCGESRACDLINE